MSRPGEDDGWDSFLARFHGERAGITERILSRSVDPAGATPYDWVAERIPDDGLTVDVACGSAPLWSPRLAGRYLGVDASDAELRLARDRGAHPVTRGSADDLPAENASAAAVICSMALMILPDLPTALAEARRVLAPGGELIAILPTSPRGAQDILFGIGLVKAAREPLGYRNDSLLRRPRRLFADQGLALVEDARRTYRFDLRPEEAAAAAAASLYLRNDQVAHRSRIAHYLQRSSRSGRGMPVPIRRIIARPMH